VEHRSPLLKRAGCT